MMDICCYCSGY